MTRNTRVLLANDAERWIRAWSRPDVSREDAAVMVTYWHLYEPTDPELVDEVLSRFSPAEPPAVAGLDFLAVEQDAKTIVAESLRPGPLAELLPDTGGWDDDLDVCPSCRKPYSPSWSSHCETCHGPRRIVSGGAS